MSLMHASHSHSYHYIYSSYCVLIFGLICSIFIFTELFSFIGQRAELGFPGSPYAIDFRLSTPYSSEVELMNVSSYTCGDTLLGCSCGDCPSSFACSRPEPPPHKRNTCSIKLGSLRVWFSDISMCLFVWFIILFFNLMRGLLFNNLNQVFEYLSVIFDELLAWLLLPPGWMHWLCDDHFVCSLLIVFFGLVIV